MYAIYDKPYDKFLLYMFKFQIKFWNFLTVKFCLKTKRTFLLHVTLILLSLIHLMYWKCCFVVKFLKGRFWWIYMFSGPLSLKIPFLAVSTYASYQQNLHILYSTFAYHAYLKLFEKIGQKLCVQGYTKNSYALRPMDGILCSF